MIELMIALGIFSIFLAVVLSSVISITRASTRVQVTALSSSAELAVFQRLDHQIRYSDSINFPGIGAPSGDMYIEFRTPAESTTAQITLCTQWRFDLSTRSVQSRKWNDVVGAVPGAWETDLTNVANDGGANYPFQLLPATNNGSTMQQLVLTLDTGNAAVKGAAISSTFVARNSSIQSSSNTDDLVLGTSDSPICPAGSRP
jgi:type II secretory pathway pseudopilin PulG